MTSYMKRMGRFLSPMVNLQALFVYQLKSHTSRWATGDYWFTQVYWEESTNN